MPTAPINLKAIQHVEVYRKTIALDGANDSNVDVLEGFPEGKIRGLSVRLYSAACTGLTAGTASALMAQLIKSFSLGSSAHGVVINSIKGMLWDDYLTAKLLGGIRSQRTAPTVNGFDLMFYIPLDGLLSTPRRQQFRGADTAMLNIKNKAKPYLNMILGPYSLLGTGITACSVTVEVVAHYEPRPQPGAFIPGNPLGSGDEPTRQFYIGAFQKSDLSTSSTARFSPGLMRVCPEIFFRELDNTQAKVTDIFTGGPAGAAKMELVYGTEKWISKVKLFTLDRIYADREGFALPGSCHLLQPQADGKLLDGIDVSEGRDFYAEFDGVAVSANRIAEFMPIFHVPVKDTATYAALSQA